MERVVAIGDLNADDEVLETLLRGLRLVDRDLRWCGGATHLIQVGDVFNRGGGARRAYALLWRLAGEAEAAGGRVTTLLGNHEVMTALGHEGYCTADEYLAFARARDRRAWPKRRMRRLRALLREHGPEGPIPPLEPRLAAWEVNNVPGRQELRRALGPRGRLGRRLRRLPIAVRAAGCVFCHAPIAPRWAELGIAGLNAAAREAWERAPAFYRDLERDGLFTAADGPLWNRVLARVPGDEPKRELARSLAMLDATRMVSGHTRTARIPGGEAGRIALRHRRKLVCIDVGLGEHSPAALILEGTAGYEWTPRGRRHLFGARH